MQGWRNTMEDAHLTSLQIDSNTACFGVFDGHGGKEVALFAGKHFAEELVRNPKYLQGDVDSALQETFLLMDTLLRRPEGAAEVYRLQRDLPDSAPVNPRDAADVAANVGCTAVVALVQGNTLYVANAGDSRCVLSHSGKAVDMSMDHKPDLPEENARIRAAGGCVVEGRVNGNINLSRSLGDLEYKNVPGIPPERQAVTSMPDIRRMELTPEDQFIVLCCDGIWDILTSQNCVDFINERLPAEPLKQIAEEVCDRCLAHSTSEYEGRGCDNMTVVIVAFQQPS
jgi:serine/threonine protein phosphatase PrpC